MPQDGSTHLPSLPASPQSTPGVPENYDFVTFDGFEGLNTKPTRPAIGDQQMFICDNLMPIGKNNLRALPDIGTALYSSGGLTVQYFNFGNLSDTPVMIAVHNDGSIKQINTNTKAVTVVAGQSTISDATQQIGFSQWGSQYIIMSAPQTNGYFIWDGTSFYKSGTIGPQVTLTNSGLGYTSAPTITTTGGSGSGATFTTTLNSSGNITTISVTNPGSGYLPNDFVVLNFASGGSVGTTAIASPVLNSSGGLVAVTILSAQQGAGYTTSATATVKGGGGIGASIATITLSGTGISAMTVGSSGQGYGTNPTIVISDPNNPVAQATVTIMPFGIQGSSVEVFTSRVWVANGAAPTTPPLKNLNYFTAPNSVMDFNTSDGAGQFLATNSFLRVGYHALKQSNGFLYLLGDSSVDYISGVNTTGAPPITTFTNQNVDPQIGTPWGNTTQVFSRAICFANTFGVFTMYGGAVQKVSAALDGIYTTVTPTGSTPKYGTLIPSSAVAIIYGIHVYCLLLPILDQISNAQRNALLIWDGTKWFTASTSVSLTYIASQEINSILTAYGTDGNKVYPLFNTTTTSTTKTVRSKLWGKPNFALLKNVNRFWGLLQSVTGNPVTLTVNVDTENSTMAQEVVTALSVPVINSMGRAVSIINNSAATVTIVAGGVVFFPQFASIQGQLAGLTVQSTAADFTLVALMLGQQLYKLQI